MKKSLPFLFVFILSLTLAAPAHAAGFVPSVEQKQAPSIVTDPSGNAAVITDSNGTTTPVSSGMIIVTPLSEAEQASDEEMADIMQTAYTELKGSASISDVCQNYIDVLTIIDSSLTDKDMVIKDVFDISAYGDAKQLIGYGRYIRITLDTDLDMDIPRIVLHYKTNAWNAVDPDKVIANADKSTTIIVDSLSPFAIVVPTSAIDDPEVTSPQTSDESVSATHLTLPLAAMALVIGTFSIASKKKSA